RKCQLIEQASVLLGKQDKGNPLCHGRLEDAESTGGYGTWAGWHDALFDCVVHKAPAEIEGLNRLRVLVGACDNTHLVTTKVVGEIEDLGSRVIFAGEDCDAGAGVVRLDLAKHGEVGGRAF